MTPELVIEAAKRLVGDHYDFLAATWEKDTTAVAIFGGEGGYAAIRYKLSEDLSEIVSSTKITYREEQRKRRANVTGSERQAHRAAAKAVHLYMELRFPEEITSEDAFETYAAMFMANCSEATMTLAEKKFREWWTGPKLDKIEQQD